MSKAKWEKVGYCSVDAGLIAMGDPCYLADESDGPRNPYANWPQFCDKLFDKKANGVYSLPHEAGHEGKAVVVESGWGDGRYPVYVKRNKNGQIMKALISFGNPDE